MSYTVTNDNLIKDGEYEAFIEEVVVKTTQSGKEYLSLKYRIRKDVEQEEKGRVVFESIWKDNVEVECFKKERINKLLNAIGIKVNTVINGVEDLLKTLKGGHLIIVVRTRYSEYKGEDENNVYYYKKSKADANIQSVSKVEEKKEESKVSDPLADPTLPF